METEAQSAIGAVLTFAKRKFREIIERDTTLTDGQVMFCAIHCMKQLTGVVQTDNEILINAMLSAEDSFGK